MPGATRTRRCSQTNASRSRPLRGYQEDLSEAFGNLTRYLGLVGLAALVLGSIGVAAGVRVFVREKLDTVALLRSIGASPRDVVAIYTGLAICLGLAAGTLGIVLCLPLVGVLPSVIGRPAARRGGPRRSDPRRSRRVSGLSVWATLVCAMGPVLDLARVAPLRALRRDFGEREAQGQRARDHGGFGAVGRRRESVARLDLAGRTTCEWASAFALGLIVTVGDAGACGARA